jgi:Ca2+-binding EF-hand superfamily protein
MEQVQRNGLAVDEAFRHFDTDGNGFITREELEEGLAQLGIFDNANVKDWRSQVPDIIVKFDKSNDGNVSLKEFFSFLGVESYAPNIVQKMTKIFAKATEKGMSFKDIFTELDEDQDGKFNAIELQAGLQKLGTFGEVSVEDSDIVVKQFDHSGDGTVSLDEFINFFSTRVTHVASENALKKQKQAISRFCDVMIKAQEKGVTVDSIFTHFDKDKGGSLSTTELATGLRNLPHFNTLSDEDIDGLIKALDADSNGSISLSEFKAFVTKASPTKSLDIDGISRRFHVAFERAEDDGLSFQAALEHLARDGDRELTMPKLRIALMKLPHLKGVSEEEIRELVEVLDTDKNGMVSFDKFAAFFGRAVESRRDSSRPIQKSQSQSPKEIFCEQLRRIAKADGGIEGLLASLDDDEDGLISSSSLMRYLAQEQMFQYVSEEDIKDLLSPLMIGRGDINVVALLQMYDDNGKSAVATSSSRHAEKEDDDEEDDRKILVVEYDFSVDPETRSLEKKLRALGRSLCKKGMDIEAMFRAMDVRHTGVIRRTEFIEILSKMGLSILEKGKAMDEATSLEAGQGSRSEEARRLQTQQIRRLKGGDGGYSQNATRAARKLLMNTGSEEYKESGDFKVRSYSVRRLHL